MSDNFCKNCEHLKSADVGFFCWVDDLALTKEQIEEPNQYECFYFIKKKASD